jgi:PAS domain S-box-containing protein
MLPRKETLRGAATGLAVTAAYVLAGKVGLSLAFVNASASAVWPPTGIALAAFLILGNRIWPGVLLGAFLVNVTTAGNVATSVVIAAGNTLEGFVGCWLVRRFAGGLRVFDQPSTVFKFAVLAGMVSTAVSATIGTTTLALGGFARWNEFGPIWLTWWMGDGAGALIVTPLIVQWWLYPKLRNTGRQWGELASLLLTLVALALFVFYGFSPFHDKRYPMEYLCLPPLLWAAFRFGPREAITSVALLSGIAIFGTLRGIGPFADRPPSESLLLLQGFMTVLSIVVLSASAAVLGRRRVEASMRQLNEELERRVAERTEQLWRSNEGLREQIVQRARGRKKLERSEARLREAQRAARMGSWEWDIVRNTLWWSDELYSIYGLEPHTFAASYEAYLERIHPEDREIARGLVAAALREKEPFSFEHRILLPDGTVRVILGQGDVITDRNGRPIRMAGTGQDITEHKRAENERASLALEQEARREAEEANRIKDEFLAVLSHELRTPLNAIVGWANLLKEGRLDPPTTARAVETINRNIQIQSHLISDIMDISRMAAGQLYLKKQAVDLASVVESALDTMKPTALAKNVRLDRDLAPIGKAVLGDPDRLQQVIWNMLSNAIKFAPEGGRVVIRLDRNGETATIRVEDNGPGVDPEFLPHVFERFRQRDSSGTRRHGGLGLGLAIVRHLVEMHGGSVAVSNVEGGKGAVFSATLPLVEVPAIQEARERDTSPEASKEVENGDPSGLLSGSRILLVEDDRDSRELIAMFLARQGAQVSAVSSCREAFVSLESQKPDLLISDIAMPGESGYDLIARLRALPAERGGALPAVALTAYAGAEDASRALRAGFDVHMAKPVQMMDLVRILRGLIQDS